MEWPTHRPHHHVRARRVALLAALAVSLLFISLPASAFAAYGVSSTFGVSSFTAEANNEDGTLDTQAGSHPYSATTGFAFNTTTEGLPAGNVRDTEVNLPVGFVGNPQATPQCAIPLFDAHNRSLVTSECPADTQVGITELTFAAEPEGTEAGIDGTWTAPVYNLVPQGSTTAEFGVSLFGSVVKVHILASVRSASDYGVRAIVEDIGGGARTVGLAELTKAQLTLWGVPADPAHDTERGMVCGVPTFDSGCRGGGQSSDAPPIPFLTNPTECQSGPLTTTLRVDSWQNPGAYLTYGAQSPQPTGCERLSFHPSLTVEPEAMQADTPSGYTFRLGVPQNPNTYGLATPELDNAKVALPRGVSINPSAANGLQGCTDEQIEIGTEDPVTCPAASKLGTAEVFTPLLADGPGGEAPLSGAIYLGTPIAGQEYRIFLVVEGHGVSVRLQGSVSADPVTGQLTATFEENPPLPFSELVLRFFGGSKAALANPLGCGPATTTSDLTPYGSPEVPDATPASTFQVTGCAGNPAPFTPSLTAGTAPSTAGTYSPFTFQLSRGDGQQYVSQISAVSLPPGLLGNISSVPLCGSGEAAAGTCGQSSQIGTVTVGSGAGATPFYLGGTVYLTEGYDGDPFGLAIVVPAIAGPYDLGTVVVRAGIAVNPQTAAITVQADPVPTILEGIPLRLRYIGVTLDRPSFILNPTNCAQRGIVASVDSQQGSTASLSSPFVASGCASLPFAPVFVTATPGAAARTGNGAGLIVRVAQAPGEAGIRMVHVELPKKLPARLTTLQKACTEAQFAANPAGCPAASVVGTAVAHTPLLPVPLQGPAYFVSHGGKAFPELVLVLQGDGVTIDLAGETFIDGKTNVTSSTFRTVPDAPITSFELRLPEQKNSALAAPEGNLCGKSLVMPTTIEGQNGKTSTQETQVTVTGCKKVDPKAKKLSRSQKLAKALKVCKKRPKKQRASCEKKATKKYGPTKKAKQSSNGKGRQ